MTSSRPYIMRALYEWIVDNDCTPYVLVDATVEDVMVPQQFVKDGQIVLNISRMEQIFEAYRAENLHCHPIWRA